MGTYWNDYCGRYGTGESYDWFPKYPDGVETFDSNNELWTYTEVDGGIELLRYNGDEKDIVVPSHIDGKQVLMLNSTFDGFLDMKSVVIPEGVVNIEGAFYGCENLEKVTLPNSITDMSYAFSCCYSLKEIILPCNVKDMSWAFQGVNVKKMDIPSGVENISYIICGTDCIESVKIPKTVNNMYNAFESCENLKEVILEEGLQTIEEYAFFHCPNLKELIIPSSVTYIEKKSVGFMEIREYTDSEKTSFKIKGEQIVPGFVIKGATGSAAEKYAKENGIIFVMI